ncbi:putative nucleic acid-binding protein [Rhizobium sp. SG_E_25_P2]|uniref:type II toxin-antitoxin system VapC family toxin n=1 Tax=Rhizobium sp. SG_E_25_P2 TaxID=2879942 RepID=UPI0024731615|nr:type II toxin-antitoxin system VapC family toxin [Rhizobium sp. SG_E_25_P2]MDH6268409.1 putative nucleic acid-binding protein [Rhizobium sp. SG_E_25_P2]
MVTAGQSYFWDSCVFIAFLNNDRSSYDVESLEAFLKDSEASGGPRIFTSSIALAEVSPGKLKNSAHSSFSSFLNDFRNSISVVDTSPFININAGLLKDVRYKKGASDKRILTTGDAIMLATALEIEETYGIKLDAFHTYDNGRGKGNPEGRGVPILGFHEWLDDVPETDLIKRVVALNRVKPIHPEPSLI